MTSTRKDLLLFSISQRILTQIAILIVLISLSSLLVVANQQHQQVESSSSNDQINRKSIVFDIKTPKVFYCPQEKQSDSSKMIVKAKPLDRLCQFEGKQKPKNTPSDCYNDVDETQFACDEKKRFMMRLDLSAEVDSTSEGIDDLDYILTKISNKKKANPTGKKY